MPGPTPKVSPVLQGLIDKGLFDRLPPTFATFFYDQIKDWALLFPAEQSYHERLFSLIDRSPAAEVEHLFAPMREAERLMGVNEKNWPSRQFTLEQVDFLNRSPHYAEWRKAVSGVFARLDPLLDAEVQRHGRPRLVVVVAPGDLPAGPNRMWLRIAKQGRRVALETPNDAADFLPLLLTGALQKQHAPGLADLCVRAPKRSSRYAAWTVETGESLASVSGGDGVVRLSYERLREYRQRLMKEVQQVVETEQIRGPRQLGARLKELKIRAGEGELSRDPILAEFARASLLSGNGTLLINNTFVEWATVQAVRRARPDVVLIGFGIRNKVKPFSSMLIYADQEAITPVPTQADVLGSYVDLELLYQYIWQEFGKYPEYRGNTTFLFVGDGLEEMLVIAPADYQLPAATATKPVPLATVFQTTKDWLGV